MRGFFIGLDEWATLKKLPYLWCVSCAYISCAASDGEQDP